MPFCFYTGSLWALEGVTNLRGKFAVQRGEVLCPDGAVIVANVQLQIDYGVTGACCTKR